MLASKLKVRFERLFEPLFHLLNRWGVRPNFLTLAGLAFTCLSFLTLLWGKFTPAGVLILVAGLFDMLDGGVARSRGDEEPFGAFLDSIIDRYSDLILLIGVLLHYSKAGRIWLVALTCLVIMGSVLIPYARARAERFLPQCNVGWMERPERIIVLAAGAIFHQMPLALALLAFLTHFTVFQRIHYSWKNLSKPSAREI